MCNDFTQCPKSSSSKEFCARRESCTQHHNFIQERRIKSRHMLHKRKHKYKHTTMTERRDRSQSQGEFGDDFTIPLRGELSSAPGDDEEGELSLSSLTIRPRRRRNGRKSANRNSRRTLRSNNDSSMSSFASSTSSGSSRISFECDSGDILLAISASSGLDLLDAEEDGDDDNNNDNNTNNDDASSTSQTSNPQTPRNIPRRGMQHYRRHMSTSMASLVEVDGDEDNSGADTARPVVSRLNLAIMRHNGVAGSRSRHRASRRDEA